ncbi:MAG: glutamine synthetase type III, partial [Bacteroidaceae bacterium]|nr:glutamine synthetase type III [Bacteroidaceae bacterium]
VLNTAVAEALTSFKKRVDEHIANGEDKTTAIVRVLREDIKLCKPIHFEGNGYSDEWKAEAAKRGLDCETSCPLIFDRYLDADSIRMFEEQHVMRELELKARNEIKWDTYTKKIQIEARVFGDMAMNQIIPVAMRYQSMLIDNVSKIAGTFPKEEADKLNADNIQIIREISEHTRFIIENVKAMVEARKVANKIESEREKAVQYHDTVQPYLESIRYHVDKLELLVEDELWVLPKYRELLFIR